MANKTFNIYCDESCHLEHDHKKFMFLGSISSAFPQVRRHSERIKELKKMNEKQEEYVYKYYYLLTAYKLEGKDEKRNKIERLYQRRHNTLL